MQRFSNSNNTIWDDLWPMVCGVSILIITTGIWYGVTQRENSRFQQSNLAELNSIEEQTTHGVGERVRSIERMAARLSQPDFINWKMWQIDANKHLEHYPDLNSIAVLNSNYYLEHIEPAKLMDLVKDRRQFNWEEKRVAALKRVAEKKQSTITGVVKLRTGNTGIVIVAPILRGARVTGYVLAVIRPQDFFRSLNFGDRQEIEIKDGKELIFSNRGPRAEPLAKSVLRKTSSLYGVELEFQASPKLTTLWREKSFLPESILLFGAIIAVLFFFTLRFARSARSREYSAQLAKRRLDALLSLAPVAIFETAPSGICTYTNQTWNKFTGLSTQESLGLGWLQAIHPADKSLVFSAWENAVNENQTFQLRFRYANVRSGEIHWVECRAEPVFGAKGEALGYLGAAIDFTSQKEAEDRARETQSFIAEVLDNLPIALYCKDIKDNYNFTLWNKEAEKIWGKERSSVLGRNDFEIFPEPFAGAHRGQDESVAQTSIPMEIADEEYVRMGNVRHLHMRKVPVSGSDGQPRYLLGIAEDITDKLSTQRLLEEQRLILIQEERMTMLGEMAGGIAHEINNPLTIIEGYSQQIRSILQRDNFDQARLEKAADGISATIQRIAKIIRGLKSLSRDGAQDPLERASISEILRETLDFCQTRFSRLGVELTVLDEVGANTEIKCRKVQISQVLLNLLVNALDAVADSTRPRIKVLVAREPDLIKVSVIDSGKGIPRENIDKIMNPFFTTKQSKGTGLGLSISSSIMKSHGGRLYLDTAQSETCFTLELPLSGQTEGSVHAS